MRIIWKKEVVEAARERGDYCKLKPLRQNCSKEKKRNYPDEGKVTLLSNARAEYVETKQAGYGFLWLGK
jgi:hypothetical protein